MNILYIIRGLPGAGKTSLLHTLKVTIPIDMDDWRETKGDEALSSAMSFIEEAFTLYRDISIAVADVFERQDECLRLKSIADKLGARSVFMVVENYHGTEDVHGVFDDKMQTLAENFQIQLW